MSDFLTHSNTTEKQEFKLSDQALGALMMALQKSLLEQTDITGVLREFQLTADQDGQLTVENPPVLHVESD